MTLNNFSDWLEYQFQGFQALNFCENGFFKNAKRFKPVHKNQRVLLL